MWRLASLLQIFPPFLDARYCNSTLALLPLTTLSLHLITETIQSIVVTMATACLSPLSFKIWPEAVISAPSLFISQMVCRLLMIGHVKKNRPNAPLIDTPTSRGPSLERRVTRRGKCIYIPYEYSLSHFCLRNYLILEKQPVNYWWMCFLQWPE